MFNKTVFLLLIALLIAGYLFLPQLFFSPRDSSVSQYLPTESQSNTFVLDNNALVEAINIPWGIAFMPDGSLAYSERGGQISVVSDADTRVIYDNQSSTATGEGGLLGIALHPNFDEEPWLYLYETYATNAGQTLNRVVRYEYSPVSNPELFNQQILIDAIPGAAYHDGGRIAFGPDELLYITTGDATEPNLSQDLDSLAGKILRLHDDGSIPADNPFPNSPIYSYGHRNPQGLAWDPAGNLYSTEHGPSGLKSGQDELNLIIAGGNYGWPHFSGSERPGPAGDSPIPNPRWPIATSGPDDTWAPAGLSFWQGDLWFGGLRGQALYQYDLESSELTRHLFKELGRIRTTAISPEGQLVLTTSNRDGRGNPVEGDDRILIYRFVKSR